MVAKILETFLKCFGSVHAASVRTHDTDVVHVLHVIEEVRKPRKACLVVVEHHIARYHALALQSMKVHSHNSVDSDMLKHLCHIR